MNILVTGGLGFIGSNFIKHMLNKYPTYKIINLDLMTYAGNIENLSEYDEHPNYHFFNGNICNQELVTGIVSNFSVDAIVNFAAESHVDRSFINPRQFIETNILGTHTLMDVSLKHNVKKFVQISTDEVYGELGDKGVFNEHSPISPNNPYSATKAGADLLAKTYHKTFALNVSFVRFANTYGFNQFPEKLIPMTITHALKDIPIPIHGDGRSIRDWLFVMDNCNAIDMVMHNGRPGEVYNLGAKEEIEVLSVVEHILEILDKPKSLITFVDDRLSQDYRYANDPSKIMNELGWKPNYKFETGIRETINWYKANQKWWTRLAELETVK